MSGPLSGGDLMRMALRASALQATWNYERQQGLGWAYSLEPALERLYGDPTERRDRIAEHTAYFNTQPTLASVALGAVARLEERRAAGEPLGTAIDRIKGVLGSSLAAYGDRLFWFSLRPVAALLGVLLVASGIHPLAGALVLWLCYNVVHQSLRVFGVRWGYARGPEVLDAELRGRLEGLIRSLAAVGTLATGVLVAMVLVPQGVPRPLNQQVLFGAGLALGLAGARLARPSPTEWALVGGLACVAAAWL